MRAANDFSRWTAKPKRSATRAGLLAGASINGLTAPLYCMQCGVPHTPGALTCPYCEIPLQRTA